MNNNIKHLKKFSGLNTCLNEESINAASPKTEMAQGTKVIHCFYNRPFYPCSFTTNTERKMEHHYSKVHYPEEVIGWKA